MSVTIELDDEHVIVVQAWAAAERKRAEASLERLRSRAQTAAVVEAMDERVAELDAANAVLRQIGEQVP